MLLKVEKLIKYYKCGRKKLKALNGIDFEAEEGEIVVLCGASGSGKSTFLKIIGGIERATSGKVCFYDTDITMLNEKQMNDYRRRNIGFLLQNYTLIDNISVRQNLMLTGESEKGIELLCQMGLGDKIDFYTGELTDSEAQRVALARAMAKSPAILLCDEPTFELDNEGSFLAMNAIIRYNRENGLTVIMASKNKAQQFADRTVYLNNGKVEYIEVNRCR